MKIVWIILAAIGAVLAIVFVMKGDYEKAFLAAAAGAVCWFLSYRVQMKEIVQSNESANEQTENDDEE